MTRLIVLATIVVVGLAAHFFSRVAAGRGPRLVERPENDEPAAVSVNAVKAAAVGRLELSRCFRWPERGQCGRECLTQIERSDDGCLVRRW